MSVADLTALTPFIILAATTVVVMLTIAFYRSHMITVILTLSGLVLSAASIPFVSCALPRSVTPLLMIDHYSLFFIELIFAAGFAVASLSYSYLEIQQGHKEEFYLLLIIATLGCSILAASIHFASFFLGIELLSISLYALVSYLRHSDRGVEAGIKYLILAAVSSAFILFGMALVYAESGSMAIIHIAAFATGPGTRDLAFLCGLILILVGLGFKLAVVPFHMWTPDVYEGAPAPVTAFIATVSKGAVFALVLRYFTLIDIHAHASLFAIFTIIAIASMFAGNLLALFQTNVKRILAYSSISHLGYLLVTVLASGPMTSVAAAFYLTAYFITTLGAFGVITVMSVPDRDADRMDDYQGLAWRRPRLAGIFTFMLFSLAGIPLTAGFVGKFYIVAAGVGSALWFAVIMMIVNSVIGLFYYLRIIVAMFSRSEVSAAATLRSSRSSNAVLAALVILLIWLGVYPGPIIDIIRSAMFH
jgi:NADH-quinone oxidoreductase subunit N